ncbi:MAG TPA: hypothetical protein PLL69_07895, partial [Gemmatimonadales bacterium]|nr:hypothetical protein [Gemmatimonadales bacterium]
AVFDTPPQTVQRYQVERHRSPFHPWWLGRQNREMPAGMILRIRLRAAATVHWSSDDWRSIHDTPTRDTGLGVHLADLDTAALSGGSRVRFTLHWTDADHWEGRDFELLIIPTTGATT